MSESERVAWQNVGRLSGFSLGGLVAIGVVQAGLLVALAENISIIGLICSLGLTYVNAVLGWIVWKFAFRGGVNELVAVGLLGNMLRAGLIAVLMVTVLQFGIDAGATVLLVTLLGILAVWGLEIGRVHCQSLKFYQRRHE